MLQRSKSAQSIKLNRAPLGRPGARASVVSAVVDKQRGIHALTDVRDNAQLMSYERSVKDSFDRIEPVLRQLVAIQFEIDFASQAKEIADRELGFELPIDLLNAAWTNQLDIKALYAYCVFETYRRFCDHSIATSPLAMNSDSDFDELIEECGLHAVDLTPCADGRLAHVIRSVLRLPPNKVRRKSYAGAVFDIDDNVQKWTEVELLRERAGLSTSISGSRYLKGVVYHFSTIDGQCEGCAAHGSKDDQAALAGRDALYAFREAIEHTHCCGASVDLLLIGVDTATDSIRVHVPDEHGDISLNSHLSSIELFEQTQNEPSDRARDQIQQVVARECPTTRSGLKRFVGALIENNLSQIELVKAEFNGTYADIGHAERFIGVGVGFEEIQVRNLMYFAYLKTIEEGVSDVDVGLKIFKSLNISRGLPAPIIVRFDYHGSIPGARARAMNRCQQITEATIKRFPQHADDGSIHILKVVRDCQSDSPIEIIDSSVPMTGIERKV